MQVDVTNRWIWRFGSAKIAGPEMHPVLFAQGVVEYVSFGGLVAEAQQVWADVTRLLGGLDAVTWLAIGAGVVILLLFNSRR